MENLNNMKHATKAGMTLSRTLLRYYNQGGRMLDAIHNVVFLGVRAFCLILLQCSEGAS